MSKLLYTILDTILFAIPEAIFVTAMTYTLLKRHDLIDIYKIKSTLRNLLLPSVTSTIIMMSLSYLGLGVARKIIGLTIFYLLLLFIIKKDIYTNIIKINIKTLICFLLSSLILLIIESTCMLVLMGLLNIDSFNLLNNNDNYSIKALSAFSWIIVESLLIITLNIKKNNRIITILQTILKNKELIKITIYVITPIILVMTIFIYLTLFVSLLDNISMLWQMGITISIVVILPLSAILLIHKVTILFINAERRFQQLYQEIDN